MSTIVKYKNQSGVVYAYQQESYYDPVTKSSRPKRKCIGKIDPVTGEIIPSKGRAKKNMTSSGSEDYETLYKNASAELNSLKEKLFQVEQEKRNLQQENKKYSDLLSSFSRQINKAMNN